MHISDGKLRAFLDHELSATAADRLQTHLSRCERCRRRADALEQRAARVHATLLETAAPEPDSAEITRAWARVQAARQTAPSSQLLPLWLAGFLRQPQWRIASAGVMMGLLFLFPPVRAAGKHLFGILRVKTVVAVPVEHDFADANKGKLISDLLADSITVTKDEKTIPAASRQEAAGIAGFTPLLPALRQDEPKLRVEGERAFYLTVKKQRVEAFLNLVERPDVQLPEHLDGAQVAVDVPRSVFAAYGECPKVPGPTPDPTHFLTCLTLAQVPAGVTVVTIPQLDLTQLAELGLQVTGMTAEQAHAFSSSIDWHSTLAIPVPRESAVQHAVRVQGEPGVLVIGRQRWNWPEYWTLIWVKEGRIYSLSGFGDSGSATAIAESLQ